MPLTISSGPTTIKQAKKKLTLTDLRNIAPINEPKVSTEKPKEVDQNSIKDERINIDRLNKFNQLSFKNKVFLLEDVLNEVFEYHPFPSIDYLIQVGLVEKQERALVENELNRVLSAEDTLEQNSTIRSDFKDSFRLQLATAILFVESLREIDIKNNAIYIKSLNDLDNGHREIRIAHSDLLSYADMAGFLNLTIDQAKKVCGFIIEIVTKDGSDGAIDIKKLLAILRNPENSIDGVDKDKVVNFVSQIYSRANELNPNLQELFYTGMLPHNKESHIHLEYQHAEIERRQNIHYMI